MITVLTGLEVDEMFLVSNEMYLAHHGIRGQKWGVRRYRNEDGTLTETGKRHYASDAKKFNRAYLETERKYKTAAKRANKLHNYSKRPRWLMDDEITTNKAKRFERADRRYDKSLKKAEKLFNDMSKKYSDVNIVSIDSDTATRGAEIMLMRRYHDAYRTAMHTVKVEGFS